MTRRSKLRKLKILAKKRKKARWKGYGCIGDNKYHGGKYECDFVSPYTKSAGNVDSKIMVMLQDWLSESGIKKRFDQEVNERGLYAGLPTNKKLGKLLRAYFDVGLCDIYATNLFPFVKKGRMSATIPPGALERAAKDYGIPQINIVNPRLVICLGIATFRALLKGYKMKAPKPNIGASFRKGRTMIWCQAHTGNRGQNSRNLKGEKAPTDWRRMRNYMARKGWL